MELKPISFCPKCKVWQEVPVGDKCLAFGCEAKTKKEGVTRV